MSFVHADYVGYFDPADPFERADPAYRLLKPKPQRPLSRDAVECSLRAFAPGIAVYVEVTSEGYVICHWSRARADQSEQVRDFARTLAEAEGALIMNENFFIDFPLEAKRAQEESWATTVL